MIGDETVIDLQRAKVYVFSDSVLCLESVHQHPESNEAWKKRIEWITTDKSYRDYDGINGEPTEFEWNIFPGFTTLQYFMTKDTEEQFFARDCREYTLPRNDELSQPKGWIQGNTRNGPVLEVTTSYLYGKHGIEIRIWSVSEDNSHSWVRISHGSNKFVIDSNYNNTEIPADLPEEQASQLSVKVFCSQIKGESKTIKERACLFAEHHSDE